jgi:hypothetical protein
VIDPSRFLLELPDEVSRALRIAEERRDDGFESLPAAPRYQLPAFAEPLADDQGEGEDDDVN